MGGSNITENIISIDTKDHYTAHILLAECYKDINELYYCGNIASANLIKKHFGGKTPDEYREACRILHKLYPRKVSDARKNHLRIVMLGDGNPFYGKKHSNETKIKMSKNHADIKGGNNPAAKACMDMLTGKKYGSIKEMAADLKRRRCTIGKYVKDINNERFCYVK
jgi:hypothetical protein